MKKILLPLFAAVFFAIPARAQFIGYVSPQTVQQSLASNVACSGAPQVFSAINLGQTQHLFTVQANATTTLQAVIRGIDTNGVTQNISDTAVIAQNGGVVQAAGYFPITQIVITCTPVSTGAFSIAYSGASATNPVPGGVFAQSQTLKQIWNGFSTSTPSTFTFNTPFGNEAGYISFLYASGAAASGTLAVTCKDLLGDTLVSGAITLSLANVGTIQTFQLPPIPCPQEALIFTPGSGTAVINVLQSFNPAGSPTNITAGTYSHITGTTATAVKAVNGILVSLNVNTPAAGTISVFDLAGASCTGTPSTNTVAVITATSTVPVGGFFYNAQLQNGICVKASAAMDFTVSYQ